jgi:hypothetical protein
MTSAGKLFQMSLTDLSKGVDPKTQASFLSGQSCNEILVYRQDKVSLLICALTTRSYLIFSLTDFSCKAIDMEGTPIQRMKQYANYVIATQSIDGEKSSALRRLRPVVYDT